ncbi:uncharacterized protein ISCGN_004835 [Ixodes scapularis]
MCSNSWQQVAANQEHEFVLGHQEQVFSSKWLPIRNTSLFSVTESKYFQGLGGKHQPIKARSLFFCRAWQVFSSKWLPIRNTSLFSVTESKYFQGLGGKHQPIKARISMAHKPAGASSFSFKAVEGHRSNPGGRHHWSLPDVVWLLNLRTDEAKKKLLEAGQLVIKGKTCLVVDPARHALRLKLHWVSCDVTGDTIRRAFAEYGDVKEVTSEKWRVPDFENAESTTRLVRMVLRDGVTLDRIPHQLRAAPRGTSGAPARFPRCTDCRAFGHERTDCSRSYARAAARGTEEASDSAELLMDEEEAEQAAASAATQAKPEGTKEAAVMATTEGGGAGDPPKPVNNEEDGQQTPVTETVGKVVNVVPPRTPTPREWMSTGQR